MRLLRLMGWFSVAMVSIGQAGQACAQSPVIAGFGNITQVRDAANGPDPHIRYHVIFAVSKPGDAPGKVNPSLDRVARFMNLLGSNGIRPAPGDIVVVVYGGAIPLALTDNAYGARFGANNPNLPLVRALQQAGVTVHVCGQAVNAQKILRTSLAPEVIIDLSAITTIATLELNGWVLLPE